jgi:hypothetical protein
VVYSNKRVILKNAETMKNLTKHYRFKCYNSLTLFEGSSSLRHLQVQQAGVQLPGDPRQLVQASLRGHQRSKLTSGASQISPVSPKKYYK